MAILNDTTIWIASNNSEIASWNGKSQTGIVCLPVSVSKIWAANEHEVYTAVAIGQIGHYSNGSWQKIKSRTNTNILDVWGEREPSDNSSLVYCAVSNILSEGDNKILRINSNNTVTEKIWPYAQTVASIWFKSKYKFYACGGLVAENNSGDQWKKWEGLPSVGAYRIRGTDYNDIYVVGSYGLVEHFNGIRWSILEQPSGSVKVYYSCAVKSKTMIAVGQNGNLAMITIFRRE